jgi:citrate synthase
MSLMFEIPTEPTKKSSVVIDALDKLFILHADHEQNCSTSTVRMVGLLMRLFASISAVWHTMGVHFMGGQPVLEMLEEIT